MSAEPLDPRIRRTRQLLQQALEKLMKKKGFEEISVQDIAEAATVNRATFYDHYPDKFALLESMVGGQFCQFLNDREVSFDGTCGSALKGMVLAVCDYVARQKKPEPHMESAIIAVVRRMLLEGLQRHSPPKGASAEMTAAAASWAMYGAVKEWAQTPKRAPSEQIADTVAALVRPLLSNNRTDHSRGDTSAHPDG